MRNVQKQSGLYLGAIEKYEQYKDDLGAIEFFEDIEYIPEAFYVLGENLSGKVKWIGSNFEKKYLEIVYDVAKLQLDSSLNGHQLGFDLIKFAAEKGDERAKYYIGIHYLKGVRLKKNSEKGIRLLEESAKENYKEAQEILGYIYLFGIDVKKDIKKGLYWNKLAARNGSFISQRILGEVYYKGEIVPPNRIYAYAYLNEASLQDVLSGSERDRIEKELNPDELKKAQSLSVEDIPM